MRFQEKHQFEAAEEGTIWTIAGIPLPAPLRPIKIKPSQNDAEKEEEADMLDMTPRQKEAKIPERLSCPPAPKKPKPSLRCNPNGVEFFSPPDLESVFIRRVEKAK
ncbi:Cyclin-dependent protein kinase inhibitor SMR6 [Cocos nucifera]|uniref:Cyclin-dependent protein kinase inhibitor SMR6 n=1 Tax=Cocos nucifera TaxID=13894 RepID=A0A8K0I980_COCNU|nr:Cyclin-dependent protein kinase inhibitor SMR6 [Cocos nucifera]